MLVALKTETGCNRSAKPFRILIGGVGLHILRDMSLGPIFVERLQKLSWPDGVEVEDLSYGPVGIMHNLDAREPYDQLVLIGGVNRDRAPGSIHYRRWSGMLPDEEEVQARMAEAIAGVVSLDNLLILCGYFKKLPPSVLVIEVEVRDEDWGEPLSAEVESAYPLIVEELSKRIRESSWD